MEVGTCQIGGRNRPDWREEQARWELGRGQIEVVLRLYLKVYKEGYNGG